MIAKPKMKKWSKAKVAEFVNSKSFKRGMEEMSKKLKEVEDKRRQDFIDNVDEYIRILHMPLMGV